MEEKEKWNKIKATLWVGVVAIFLVAGFFLYQGTTSMELKAPSLSSSMQNTVEEISRLDTEYANAIEKKSKFRDMWSLIAVITGVLSAAAVVLRAPQPFVIMPGAFVALIYGAIELQSPQIIVNSLAKARGALSCVESPVRELIEVKVLSSGEINDLVYKLDSNIDELKKYSATLEIYNRRLTDVLQVESEKRDEAVAAIDKGLMIPAEDNELVIDRIKEQLNRLEHFEEFLPFKVDGRNDPQTLQMQTSLKELRSALENVLTYLESPALLQEKLRTGLKNYIEQLTRSTEILNKGNDQLKKTLYVLSKVEPTIISLKKWPKQIELVSSSANKAVRDIHSTLLLEIDQAGPTNGKIAKVLDEIPTRVAMAGQNEAVVDQENMRGMRDEAEGMLLSGQELPPNLAQQIAFFESKVKATLKRFASDIESARIKAAQFQGIIDTSLVVLVQATRLFADTTQMLKSTTNTYSRQLDTCLNALKESEQILDQVDLVELRSRIESCIAASPKI